MAPEKPVAKDVLDKIRQRQEAIVQRVIDGTLNAEAVYGNLQSILDSRPTDSQMGDLRVAQAWKLQNAGWAAALGYTSFDDYLTSIPLVPKWPSSWEQRFDRTILVDARIPITRACELLSVTFLGDDETLVDFQPEKAQQGVYWIRCQDGRKNHDLSVRDVRRAWPDDEMGLTAAEGLALYLQDPLVLTNHFLVLPGSVLRRRGLVSFLRSMDENALLDWLLSGHAEAQYGAASRGC